MRSGDRVRSWIWRGGICCLSIRIDASSGVVGCREVEFSFSLLISDVIGLSFLCWSFYVYSQFFWRLLRPSSILLRVWIFFHDVLFISLIIFSG